MNAREWLNIVEALSREDVFRMYAGDPEALAEALEDFDAACHGEPESRVVTLTDPKRDDAWAALGGENQ